MRLRDILSLAAHNLRESPLRTALCALSVAVGSGALLLILSIGLYGRKQVDVGLQTLGVSGLSVYTESGHAGTILSAALADEIEQDVDGIRTLMPIKAQSGTVRVGHTTEHAVLLGADERLGEVMQMEMLAGTLPNAWQCANAEPVAVVGDDLAQTLYRRTNITGRQIRLKVNGTDRYFTVCGVVRAQTGAFGGMLSAVAPHLVYVPYACIASQTERTDQVFVQCISQTDTASVSSQIEKYLTDRQQVRGVHVQNMSGAVQTVQQLAEMGIGLFAAVGAVTLFVALIGAMGRRWLPLTRKRDRYSAGATHSRDIRRTFPVALLCLFGGIVGPATAGALLHPGAAPPCRKAVCLPDCLHLPHSAEPLPDCSAVRRLLSIQSTQYAITFLSPLFVLY
ncbi:MAG: ABC transporter permease [Butyricicoccus sp.]